MTARLVTARIIGALFKPLTRAGSSLLSLAKGRCLKRVVPKACPDLAAVARIVQEGTLVVEFLNGKGEQNLAMLHLALLLKLKYAGADVLR